MNMQDPLEAADNAVLAPREYFGQVLVDTWFCALVKGAGKVPFDPTQHQKKFTAIKIDLMPLAEMNVTNPIAREMIAESREWVNFTLASIKALGVKTADVKNKWAKINFVPTGETYKNAAGDEKDKTALNFVAIYPDEAACRAAYEAEHGTNGNGHPVDLNPPPQKSAVANDPATRAKLLPFAKMIVRKAVDAHPGDMTAICDEVSVKIAEHGTLKNFFTATDDDVMAMITDLTTENIPF